MKVPESCSACEHSGKDADMSTTWDVCRHPTQKAAFGIYGCLLAPKYVKGPPPRWCPLREEKEE